MKALNEYIAQLANVEERLNPASRPHCSGSV
jgi:hypothetical protein